MRRAYLTIVAFSLFAAGPVFAQQQDGLRSLESGYGGARAIETTSFNPVTRDAQGNRLIVNGLIHDTSGSLSYRSMPASGAAYLVRGAAAVAGESGESRASVTAIGNLINVAVAGNGNTVILNATQSTGGAVSATVQGQ